jgi:signal transduction histidine kinase
LYQDCHDASGVINSIKIKAESALSGTNPSPHLPAIITLARKALQNLGDLFWLANEPSDHLEHLVARLKRNTEELLASQTVESSLEFPDPKTYLNKFIAGEQVKTLLLSLTEAVSNVLEHSCARGIGVKLSIEDNWITLAVEDDGVGLGKNPQLGSGLRSIRQRAEKLGGSFIIEQLAPGTRLVIKTPVEKTSRSE